MEELRFISQGPIPNFLHSWIILNFAQNILVAYRIQPLEYREGGEGRKAENVFVNLC